MPKTPVQCPVCTKFISRKEDLPRHLKTHAANKEDLMHTCTHPGCKYKTLQKSNLQTHQRTHTRNRSQTCPEPGCQFSSTDPGSLTRHRKKLHKYEPKARHNPAGKDARRAAAAPYPSTRLATPEASFSVLTAHPLSQAAQGPPNSRVGSPISFTTDSSPISWRGSSPFVVSPISSPYPPRPTSNHRFFPSISPLSTRSSTPTRRPLTISLSISPSPEPITRCMDQRSFTNEFN